MPVRPARDDEFDALSRLQSHLAEPSPDLLAAADAVGTVLVSADDRDRPVGYLLAVGTDAGDGDCHVAELAVAPDRRREGRARRLLESLFDSLPAGARVTVTVAAGNDPARSLYESVGFAEAGRRPAFFGGDDGVDYVRTVE